MLIPGIHDNVILLENKIQDLKDIDKLCNEDVNFKLSEEQALKGNELKTKLSEIIVLFENYIFSLKEDNPKVI
ncbi:MAG: hypothetical protein ACOYO1_02370 [Bacteroidales bacterium]